MFRQFIIIELMYFVKRNRQVVHKVSLQFQVIITNTNVQTYVWKVVKYKQYIWKFSDQLTITPLHMEHPF